jgi:hypothetical protein
VTGERDPIFERGIGGVLGGAASVCSDVANRVRTDLGFVAVGDAVAEPSVMIGVAAMGVSTSTLMNSAVDPTHTVGPSDAAGPTDPVGTDAIGSTEIDPVGSTDFVGERDAKPTTLDATGPRAHRPERSGLLGFEFVELAEAEEDSSKINACFPRCILLGGVL